MKKVLKKCLAGILAIVCVASTLNFRSVNAEKQETETEVEVEVPAASDMGAVGSDIDVRDVEDGVRLVFNRTAPGWGRVANKVLYDTSKGGTDLEIKDIATTDDDYSIAVKFAENTGWSDTSGYMLLYGKSGYFTVIWTDGENKNPNTSEVLVSEIREELGDSLKVHLELKGAQYYLTVNGKAYKIPSTYVAEPDALYFTFGTMGDGDIATLDSQKSHTESAISYTIAKMTNAYVPGGYEPIGESVSASNVGMNAWGESMEFHLGNQGIQVAFTNAAPAYARTHFTSPMTLGDTPLVVSLSHIYSASTDYSMVVRLGDSASGWYDAPGYLLVYGKGGDFAIIGTDGKTINPNKNPVLASDKREPLDGSLRIEVVRNGETYAIAVNGKTYTVPTGYLADPDTMYIGFGKFGDGEISSLNYDKNFQKAAFSFLINKETYTVDTDSQKSPLPLAKYKSFMSGYKGDLFKPEQELTRKEAVLAMASLLVKKSDIKDVYTTDFSDIKADDKNYDIIAYMERCGFLPDFGEKFEGKKAITRKEFVALLTDPAKTSSGMNIADVSMDDELYKKICYVVEKGILTLDANGNFNGDGTVTRAEAAKAFCIYIGKNMTLDNPKTTFKDVTDTTENAAYILLAANAVSYKKETWKATSAEEIQSYLNQTAELSKTTDAQVTIELSEELYRLEQPVSIDAASYGEYEVEVILKNAKGVTPTITGNTDLKASEFKKVDGKEYYSYQLPESSKVNDAWPKFRDLYLNGERLQLAKSDDYLFKKTFIDPGYADITGQLISWGNGMFVDGELFKEVTNENLSSLEVIIRFEWNSKRLRAASIAGIDEDTGLVQLTMMDEDWTAFNRGDGNKQDVSDWPYWFENHIALLDEPGEFYYDDENGIVYFMPYKDTDMSKATLSYPVVERLFDLKGTNAVTFNGITFTGTTSNFASEHGAHSSLGGVIAGYIGQSFNSKNIQAAAIYSEYSTHLTVKNCTFDEMGTNGIYLSKGNSNTVMKGNSFTNLAMCAAIFGEHDPAWSFEEGQSNLIIDNNYVYNIGINYMDSPGFHISRTNNIAFTHNTLVHTPYSGLMIGWIRIPSPQITVHNAEVAYNYCEDNLYAMNDGAGLYFCGANGMTTNKDVMNRVHNNYIKSTGYTGTYNGIYLDMNASNYLVYDNSIVGYDTSHGPLFNQDHMSDQFTYNNTVKDNFTTVRMITTTAEATRNIALINNQHFNTEAELPKEAVTIHDEAGQTEDYNSVVPVKENVVTMSVKEPHIMLTRQGVSDKDSVTFTITNNSDKKASYSVVYTNATETSCEMIPSTEALELKAGETGEITVAFKGGERAVRGEMVNLAVVRDNGWKMQYRRVIDIDVNSAIAQEEGIVFTEILPFIIGGVVILLAAGAVTVIFVKKNKKKKNAALKENKQ